VNRRAFIRRLAGAIVGLTLARELPGIATAPPPLPPPYEDLSIRVMYSYDADRFVTRFDVLYDWKVLNPELAVRIAG
jgi:hypothetical protein